MRCISLFASVVILFGVVGCATAPVSQQSGTAAAASQYQAALKAMKAGRSDQAIQGFEEMTRQYPTFAGPYANLGLLYQRQNLKKQAGEAFDEALALQPQSAEIYNSAGVFYRSVGRFDDAEAAYLAAIANSSEYADPALNLAILYDLYLKQPEKAIEYYKHYLALTKHRDENVALWLADLQRRTAQ